jgi:hypothetical protein
MGAKLDQAWKEIKAVGKDAMSDLGNTYQAILTQNASWTVPLPPQSTHLQDAVEEGKAAQKVEVQTPENAGPDLQYS